MQHTGASALSGLEHLYYAQNAGLGVPAQQTTIINCPKKMVGRVIGKNGETIKALQQFTGAQIQIDQRCDPTRVSIAGSPKSLQVASSMVQDIVAGTFKGFAMLRSFASQAAKAPDALSFASQPIPVYIEGYGFVPPSQFYDPLDTAMPAYQHNLHAFSPDPVSVLRAISPSSTSGSGGPAVSPQGVYGADNGNLQALSLAIAAQARMLETRDQSPVHELRTQSPGFNTSPYFQTLAQVPSPQAQQPQSSHHHYPQHAAQLHPSNFTTRALFPSDEYDLARSADKLQASPLNSSLPSLSTSSVTPSSQANGLTVWSQLEKLSPDGVPVSGSPLLTPVHTPSRSSSPITKAVHGKLRADVPLTSSPSDLLAQLQSLSIGRDPNAAPEPHVSAASFYSSGWPASTAPATPPQPLPSSAWMSMLDPEKRRFYHNWQTGQSQYEQPESWVANDVLVGGYQNGSSAKQGLPKLF